MHLWQFRPVLHNILAAKADSPTSQSDSAGLEYPGKRGKKA